MPNIRVCNLNGSNLPTQFRYKPGIPHLRASFTAVAAGVIMQHANDATPDAPRTIEFSCLGAIATEWNTVFTLYNNATPQVVTFIGYEEDSYEVVISELKWDEMRGGVIDYSGEFTVLAINNEIAAQCFSTTPSVTQTL